MPVTINGSGTITGISAGGLPDGCVLDADINGMAASKLTGALPAISGASLTGISAGITMADQWRVHSNFSVPVNSNTYITSNWERNDNAGFGLLGSGMSESSGEFTFPQTGIYFIQFHTEVYFSSNTNPRLMSRIYVTTDNSNYSYVSLGTLHASTGGYYTSGDTSFQFDVTNTSTHKVKFLYYHTGASGGATITGDSSGNETCVTFIRLGDT